MYRKRQGRRYDRKRFSKTASRSNSKNFVIGYRGGIRL